MWNEPVARLGHFSASIDGLFPCIYGGHTTLRKEEQARRLYKWDPYYESWESLLTTGSYPEGFSVGASASANMVLYTYGGADRSSHKGSLHKLDMNTMEWVQLSGSGSSPDCPMEKIGCQMVVYKEKLVLFGGYGVPSGPIHPGAEHVRNCEYPDHRGWTNEMHCFDLKEGEE